MGYGLIFGDYPVVLFERFPIITEITRRTRKTKKRILAMPVAAPAIPPKPRTAAIIAMTRNVIVQPLASS